MAFKHIILAVCFVTISMALPTKAQALSVESVRFGLYQDKTRLVLDLDRPGAFRAFVLSGPYRMVIDLPSFDWKAGSTKSPQNAGVLATRHGNLQPGISRIVFDLNRPISIQKAFTLPSGGGKRDRLVIDFANVSPTLFEQVKNKVHGTLDPNKAQSGAQTASIITNPSPPPPNGKAKKPLIIIDPGHDYERFFCLAVHYH